MTTIVLVRISLDDNVPESMEGIIRCGYVISEDENGDTKEYPDLINNKEFHSEKELISFVASYLEVDNSIVEIEA